jgi:hypothetical protein
VYSPAPGVSGSKTPIIGTTLRFSRDSVRTPFQTKTVLQNRGGLA